VSVAVVGIGGCASINVAGLLDALRKADRAQQTVLGSNTCPVFESFLVGLNRDPVTFLDDVLVQPAVSAPEISAPDVVAVPGLDDEIGASLERNKDWVRWLAEWFDAGSRVATSCTGAFLAAEAGLLDGRRATTHWIAATEFHRRYPRVDLAVDQMIVDTGDVITSGGATTFLNLVIYLMERFGGHDRAVAAAKVMLVDGDRGSQLPYMAFGSARAHQDGTVHAAQEYIEAHLGGRLTADDVARHVGVSARTLTRRFQAATGHPPTDFQTEARMFAARRLLETTTMTITEIRRTVGYHDAPAFGRAFKRACGLSPSDYRRRYGPPGRHPA